LNIPTNLLSINAGAKIIDVVIDKQNKQANTEKKLENTF
jgi:hypothetical protein